MPLDRNRHRARSALALLSGACVLIAGCAQHAASTRHKPTASVATAIRGPIDSLPIDPRTLLSANRTEIADSDQVLLVVGSGDSRFVRVFLLERTQDGAADDWTIALGGDRGLLGVVGSKGFAPPGEKREGDKRTPSGSFTLTEAFGESPLDPANPATGLAYRVADETDWWSDDPASPAYNTWVKRPVPAPGASGAEALQRDDDLYRLVVVIDYNRWPVVPGMGSGIFLHKADPDGAGTLGCVGLTEPDLKAVVARLSPAFHPRALMGTRDVLVGGFSTRR